MGFTVQNTGTNHSDIAYGYEFINNKIRIYENNNYRLFDVLYSPGDTFLISRYGNIIHYIKNSDTLRSVETDPSLELRADISFFDRGAYFKNIKASFCPVDVEVYAFDVQKDCSANSGTIKAWTKGGIAPYSYLWAPGGASDTLDTKTFSLTGKYYITVTDAVDSVYLDSINVYLDEDINLAIWTDTSGCVVSNDTIMAANNTDWSYGKAVSKNLITPFSDGFVRYLVTSEDYIYNSSRRRYLGLVERFDTTALYIDYGFFFDKKEIKISEEGDIKADSIYYKPGDVLEISRLSDYVVYTLNSDTLRKVATNPVNELRVAVQMTDSSTYFRGIKTSFCSEILSVFNMNVTKECQNNTGTIKAEVYGGNPPYDYLWSTSAVTQQINFSTPGTYLVTVTDSLDNTAYGSVSVTLDEISNIVWTDTINTSAGSSGILIKNQSSNEWDAGATSLNMLKAGDDGFIRYFVTKEGYYDNSMKQRSLGLSVTNTENDYLSADYSYYFNGKILNIIENDTIRLDSIVYKPGDTLDIYRSNDTILFIINDSVLYYKKVAGIDDLSLIADVALYDLQGYFENIKASFCPEALNILYIDAYKNCGQGTGVLRVEANGGVPPYKYDWSTAGTTQSISYTATGSYYVTVSDLWNNTFVDTLIISNSTIDNADWRIESGLTSVNDSLVKTTAGNSWSNYAVTGNIIYNQNDGEIEYLVTEEAFEDNISRKRKIGLSEIPSTSSVIGYAYYFNDDTVAIIESDTIRINGISWQPGDRFVIKRDGQYIRYLKNGVEQRNVLTDTNLVLAVKASLFNTGAYFNKIRTSFCEATSVTVPYTLSKLANDSLGDVTLNVSGGSTPYTYLWSTGSTTSSIYDKPTGVYMVTVTDSLDYSVIQPVFITDDITWTEPEGTTIITDTIFKTDTIPSWSSGAVSSNELGTYQDGAVIYTVTDTMNNKNQRVLGLCSTTNTTGYNMDYAYYFDSTSVKIYENGNEALDCGNYFTDDNLYIYRKGDTIQYVKNDTVLREVFTNPAKELFVKAVLFDTASYFENVRTSFKSESPLFISYYISDYDDLYTITLDVEGGTPPYIYSWSTGGTSDTARLGYGGYHVTVTDFSGYTSVLPVVITDVSWTGLSYTEVDENKLIKKSNAPDNLWNAGAVSVNRLEANTNGFLYYKISSVSFNDNNNYKRYFGLSSLNLNSSDTTIMYAFFLDEDSIRIYESGESIDTCGTYAAGDELQLLRKADTIIYMKNGTVLRKTYDRTLASKEIMVDVSIYERDAYLDSLKTSFLSSGELDVDYNLTQNGQFCSVELTTSGGIPPYVYEWNTGQIADSIGGLLPGKYKVTVSDYAGNNVIQNIYVLNDVVWKTADSTGVYSDTLVSEANGTGWNSGGFSSNRLNAYRDGTLRYVITENSLSENASLKRIIGLSEVDQNTSYSTVEYAYYFDTDSIVHIYESGHPVLENITCHTGDEFLLMREDSIIKYIKNDTLLYYSFTDNTYELHADAAFEGSDAYFDNIEVSFIEPAVIQYLVSRQPNDSVYTLSLDVSGGFPPYAYSWSLGGTADSVLLPEGIYYVSVTDSLGNVTTQHISLVGAVWTNLANATVSGDILETSLVSGAWTSGASSKNRLAPGENGFVYYHITSQSFSDNSSKERFFGLSVTDEGPGYDGIDYAYYLDDDSLRIYESGILQGTFGKYAAGDILQIARQGDSIRYYRNNTLLRSVETVSSDELIADVAFYDPGSYFDKVMSSFTPVIEISCAVVNETNIAMGSIEVTASGGTAPYTYLWDTGAAADSIGSLTAGNYIITVTDALGYSATDTIYILRDVAWINHTGLAVEGDTIVKTANTGWSNFAGSSANTIASGQDGYCRYIVHPESYSYNLNYYRMLGLSDKSETHTFYSIDHCLYFNQSNFEIRENGTIIPLGFTYAVGDTFEIRREGSKVYYIKNGSVFRQVNVVSSKELVVVAAIYSKNAYFENVMASFRPESIVLNYTVTDKSGSTPGYIELQDISGGVVPYEYLWSNEETTESISDLEPGAYHLTVTDSLGTVQAATFFVKNKMEWAEMVNTTFENDTLTATGSGEGWNRGAVSRCRLAAGTDGAIEYVVTEGADTVSQRVLGFCETYRGTNPVDLDYRIYLNAKSIYLFEGGRKLNYSGSYSVGDTLKLARYGSEMRYYLNSSLLATAVADTGTELMASALFYNQDAYFHNIMASFTDPAYDSGENKPVYSSVTVDVYPDKDATIQSGENSDMNFGDHDFIISWKHTFHTDRSLMEADFSFLPENAVVTSARLYLNGTRHSGTNSSYMVRITESWMKNV
jgi:hypothetical protein